jgi:two-component system nitrate/nitrite response regulator NarL
MVTADPPYSTILVGESSLLLEGIARLLDDTPFQVIDRAASVDRLALAELQDHKPLVLILDASSSRLESVLRQVELVRRSHAESLIAVLTRTVRLVDVNLLLDAGVNAFFGPETRPAIFVKSLELVMLGETFLPPTLLSSANVEAKTPATRSPGHESLSPQERLILRSLAEGQANKTIAREIGSAEATIKVHVKNIFRKIGVANRTQAAMWARAQEDGDTAENDSAPISDTTKPR